MSHTPVPVELKLHRRRAELEITFSDGTQGLLPAEYLRVHSPSAEVTGHGVGEGVLVLDKQNIGIERIEGIGRYAVRLVFDDGHNTGLYTWPILYDLTKHQAEKWTRYLDRVAAHQSGRRDDG